MRKILGFYITRRNPLDMRYPSFVCDWCNTSKPIDEQLRFCIDCRDIQVIYEQRGRRATEATP